MSEEIKNVQEEVEPSPSPRSDEIIEVSWEAVRALFELKVAAAQTEAQLSNLLLQHEKNKANFLDRLSEMESQLYNTAFSLRNSLEISPDLVYELKLPQKEGEKGYFIRKDQ